MKRLIGIGAVLITAMLITTILDSNFINPYNIKNILRWTGLFGILSVGVSFVIMTGGIDLSVGSIVGLIGGLSANLIRMKEMSIFSTLIICFGLAALMGLLHGVLVTKIKVQPFVVTLCGLFIYRGLARFILQDVTQGYGNAFRALKFLAHGRIPSALWPLNQAPQFVQEWSLPMPFVILLVVGILLGVFLNYTVFGRYIQAIGSNETAVRFSGINTDCMKIIAYIISATCACFAGILFSLDLNTVQPSTAGNMYELYAIAGCVVGGVSLRGGEGGISGVIIGTAIVRVLYNAINILGISTTLEFTIIGSVILIGASTEEVIKSFSAKRRLEEALSQDRHPTTRSQARRPIPRSGV
ncbi:MAG: ABC transporter permease [Spirochaetaceae bacterium]|nr:MAG: ABC transporter permease [Spirochaetaceae bacterium]